MKTIEPHVLPDTALVPEALIREARRRQRRRRLAIAAAVVALAAGTGAVAVVVGGGSGAGSRPRVARPAATPASPAVVTRLETASQIRLPGGGSLNLATGFGRVWVTGIGATYAVSQETGRIVATVGTPGTFPAGCGSGIATGAGAVWVTYDCRGVYRINPKTGTVTASIRVPDVGDAIAVADGLVWVTTVYDVPLRIQPETDLVSRVTERMKASIPLGGTTQVVFWQGSEWALALRRSLVILRIDPATDRIVGRPVAVGRPIPRGQGTEPSSLAAGPSGLWVLDYYRQTLFHLVLTTSAP